MSRFVMVLTIIVALVGTAVLAGNFGTADGKTAVSVDSPCCKAGATRF
jgi:hypothetical protein